ncbi:MAG: hypothetical protein FD134_2033, partial [Gallionellaceae bacterium]
GLTSGNQAFINGFDVRVTAFFTRQGQADYIHYASFIG